MRIYSRRVRIKVATSKTRIMSKVGQWISNPPCAGFCIADEVQFISQDKPADSKGPYRVAGAKFVEKEWVYVLCDNDDFRHVVARDVPESRLKGRSFQPRMQWQSQFVT